MSWDPPSDTFVNGLAAQIACKPLHARLLVRLRLTLLTCPCWSATLLLHVAAFLLCRMYARLARSTKPRYAIFVPVRQRGVWHSQQVKGLTGLPPACPGSLRTVSQALFVASTTKLFFLSLGLIWRSVEDADAPIFGLSIEDLILQATEFASRAVALSGAHLHPHPHRPD